MATKNKLALGIIGSISLAAISLSICGYSVYSIFSANKAEDISLESALVNVKIVEESPFDVDVQPDNGFDTSEKTFKVISEGNHRTYTRVALFPSIEYYNADSENWEVLGALSLNDINYTISDNTLLNWDKSDDGYYYYTKVMNQNDESSNFEIKDIELGSIPVEYKDLSLRINMYIQAEGIQATNDAYKINWGLETLSDNIEKVPSYMEDAEITKIPSKPTDEVYAQVKS